jgi:hypothetical protein
LPEEILEDLDYRRLVVDDQDSLGHSTQYMTASVKFTIHGARPSGASELLVRQARRRWHGTCTGRVSTVPHRSFTAAFDNLSDAPVRRFRQ